MRRRLLLLPLLLAPLLANTEPPPPIDPAPDPIPVSIRNMLDAAIAAGSDGDVATIVRYARVADPASADAVLARADAWRASRADARRAALADAGPLQLWSGRAEVGGFVTTGNSDTIGGTAIIDVQREGLDWRHKLRAQADYQKSLGITSRERYLFAYEPNLKLAAAQYVYGAAQFESDRFLGYDERYSLSAGIGYGAIRSPRVTLDLELGPAFRATAFTDATRERSLAARGKLDLTWKVSPGLSLTQATAAYVQEFNSTLSSNTGLAAKLVGPLSAKLSYAVQYESTPPPGRETTDTIGRAALVYSF